MSSALDETRRVLEEARAVSSSALVAYSDGKDSRVVMDMAVRTFDRVEGFFMFFVPGLEFLDTGLRDATKRWGVPIHQYPHWSSLNALKNGVFCDALVDTDKRAYLGVYDIYSCAMVDTGIPVVLTGAKRADSGWRRREMRRNARREEKTGRREVFCPLAGWTKYDVIAYLRRQGIAVPESVGIAASGVSLVTHEMLWMYDQYPNDFKTLCKYFPYAEAAIWKRKFYGQSEQGEGSKIASRDA